MQTTYVVIFVLYCLVSLAIGLWANRKTASMESFLVADRNLGVLPTKYGVLLHCTEFQRIPRLCGLGLR